MARAKMVTRTITATTAEVQIVTISASELTNINVTVSGEYPSDEALLKAIKKANDTSDVKVLKIISSEKVEKMYGMLETEFIKLAKELDPATRKIIEAEQSEEASETEATEEAPAETEAPADEPKTTKGKRGNK